MNAQINKAEVLLFLQKTMKEDLDIETITGEEPLSAFDSVSMVEIVMKVEREFNVEVDEESLLNATTINDVIDIVLQKIEDSKKS